MPCFCSRPHIPLLFMGDEYGEVRPFQFFTDFTGDLAEAVRKGRNEEFRNNKAFAEAFTQEPRARPECAFDLRRLDAQARNIGARLAFVKHLIAARFAHVVPQLARDRRPRRQGARPSTATRSPSAGVSATTASSHSPPISPTPPPRFRMRRPARRSSLIPTTQARALLKASCRLGPLVASLSVQE